MLSAIEQNPTYEAEDLGLKTWILLWWVTHLNVQLFWVVTSSSGMHGSIKWRKHFKVLCNYYLYCLFPGNSTMRTIKSWDNFVIITIWVFGPLEPLLFFSDTFVWVTCNHKQSLKFSCNQKFIMYLCSAQPQVGHLYYPRPQGWGTIMEEGTERLEEPEGHLGKRGPAHPWTPSSWAGSTRSPQDQVINIPAWRRELTSPASSPRSCCHLTASGVESLLFFRICPLVGWPSSSGWPHIVVHG